MDEKIADWFTVSVPALDEAAAFTKAALAVDLSAAMPSTENGLGEPPIGQTIKPAKAGVRSLPQS